MNRGLLSYLSGVSCVFLILVKGLMVHISVVDNTVYVVPERNSCSGNSSILTIDSISFLVGLQTQNQITASPCFKVARAQT